MADSFLKIMTLELFHWVTVEDPYATFSTTGKAAVVLVEAEVQKALLGPFNLHLTSLNARVVLLVSRAGGGSRVC